MSELHTHLGPKLVAMVADYGLRYDSLYETVGLGSGWLAVGESAST
jgi:hypothetical protein